MNLIRKFFTLLICLLMVTSVGIPVAATTGSSSTTGELEALESFTVTTASSDNTTTVNGTIEAFDGTPATNDTVSLLDFENGTSITTTTDSNGEFVFDGVEPNTTYGVSYYQGNWTDERPDGGIYPAEELPRDGVPHVFTVGTINSSTSTSLGEVTLPEAHNVSVQTVNETGEIVSGFVEFDHHSPDGHYSQGFGTDTGEDGYYYLRNQQTPGVELAGNVSVEAGSEWNTTSERWSDSNLSNDTERIVEIENATAIDDDEPLYDGDSSSTSLLTRSDVDVWQGAPLPLRADTSTAAETIPMAGRTQLRVEPDGQNVSIPFRKTEVGVFEPNSTVRVDLTNPEGADTSQYGNTSVQLVLEEIGPESDQYDIVETDSVSGEPLVVDDDGELAANVSPGPGQYLIYATTAEGEDEIAVDGDGSLNVSGTPEIIGLDHTIVRATEGEIDAPADVYRGQSFDVDLTAPIGTNEVDHTLIAYNRSTVEAQAITIEAQTDDPRHLDADNVTVKHDIVAANGVANLDGDHRMIPRAVNYSGMYTAGSALDLIENESAFERVGNETTDEMVLDVSATSVGDQGETVTVTVETLPSWETGEYELLHLAQHEDDTRTLSVTTDNITVRDEELDVDLSANRTEAEVGRDAVAFDASASSGAIVEYRWDLDGDGTIDRTTTDAQLTHVYNRTGIDNPTVTIANADGETQTAAVDLSVVDTTPPAVTVAGPSEPVDINDEFTVSANVSDNHAIDSITWTVTNEAGDIVENESGTNDSYTTTITEPGNYTVTATATDPSENEGSDATNVTVVDLANLVTTIDAADEQRLQDGVNATVTVENAGSQAVEKNFTVEISATGETYDGENETVTYESTETVNQPFQTGATETFELNLTDWTQQNRTVGTVDLTAEADPSGTVDETTNQTNTDESAIEVTYSDLETGTYAPGTVIQGTNATLRTFVTNQGTAKSGDSTVDVTIDNPTGDAAYTVAAPALGAGEQHTNRTQLSFTEAGNHTMTVAAAGDDLFPEGNQANTTFSVVKYDLAFQENATRVPAEVDRGSNFTVAFKFDANAANDVNASLDLPEGPELEYAAGETATKTVSARADRPNTVRWTLHANETSTEDLQLNASIEDTLGSEVNETDAISVNTSVPVRTTRVSDTNSTVLEPGNATGSTTIEIRNETTYQHNLTVSMQGDSAGRTLQGLEYLVRYPYGCVEQTTSAFLGALNTKQYYEDRNDYEIDDQRFDRINRSIGQGVDRLAENGTRGQLDDGSWNMWGSSWSSGETFYTGYALLGVSSVANDEDYNASNDDRLDHVDFDEAITWLNQEDQNGDGSFDPHYYINDKRAMTGFVMVSVDEATDNGRVSAAGRENAAELYENGTEYLLAEQAEDGAWNDSRRDSSATSTALAIRGLQVAVDSDALNESQEQKANASIAAGHEWLIANQESNGAWDQYQQSPYWNTAGDESEEAAFAALALSETRSTANVSDARTTDAIDNATGFLTTVYEDEGSWGYPRATAMSIEALQTLTDGGQADRTVNVSIGGETVAENVTIDPSNPEQTIVLNQTQIEDRGLGQGADSVEQTVTVDTGNDSDGIIIVAVENEQIVDRDEYEAATGEGGE